MRGEGRAGVMAEAAQNIDGTCRQPDLLHRTGDEDIADRVEFRCLHDTGIAGGKRGGDAARGHFQRVVPWDDLRRDAKGFINREVQVIRAERDRPTFHGFRLIAVIFEIARRALDLDHGFP